MAQIGQEFSDSTHSVQVARFETPRTVLGEGYYDLRIGVFDARVSAAKIEKNLQLDRQILIDIIVVECSLLYRIGSPMEWGCQPYPT